MDSDEMVFAAERITKKRLRKGKSKYIKFNFKGKASNKVFTTIFDTIIQYNFVFFFQ